MNAGKIMEAQWRKSALHIPKIYYRRMNDGTATFYGGGQDGVRFQQENPYDCFMYLAPTLYLIELKSHKGTSLPINAIRKIQLKHLSSVQGVPGIEAGFVVHFPDKEECWFADGWKVKAFVDDTERKSIPLKWFQENGIRVEVIPLVKRVEYDVKGLIDSLTERRKGKR